MNKLAIGSYVQYQGQWYLACSIINSLVTIMKSGCNSKLQVHSRNLKVSKHHAEFLWGKDDRGYLVTRKSGEVVSLTSNRWVNRAWFDDQVRA